MTTNTATKFVKVRHYARPFGKSCMHCGRSATTVALRRRNGMYLEVRYCDEHAELRGVV